jgi:hypothetical protein
VGLTDEPICATRGDEAAFVPVFLQGHDPVGIVRTLYAIVGSLPANGTLYKNDGEDTPGAALAVGSRLPRPTAGEPNAFYLPNAGYFNQVSPAQRANQRGTGFWGCGDTLDGCPDTFTYSMFVNFPADGFSPEGTYGVYVNSVPSLVSIVLAGRGVEVASSGYSALLGVTLDNPDDDAYLTRVQLTVSQPGNLSFDAAANLVNVTLESSSPQTLSFTTHVSKINALLPLVRIGLSGVENGTEALSMVVEHPAQGTLFTTQASVVMVLPSAAGLDIAVIGGAAGGEQLNC